MDFAITNADLIIRSEVANLKRQFLKRSDFHNIIAFG